MPVWSSAAELIQSLREDRTRTVTTLLGLAWGTFSIIALLAFSTGLERLLRERAAGLGRSIAIVRPQQTTRTYAGLGPGRRVNIAAADVLALPRQIPELELISPEYIEDDTVEVGDRIHRVTISGVYPAYSGLRSWRMQTGGRFLNDRDLAEQRHVAVLGNRLAEKLFGREPAVGRTLVLRGVLFTVVGVLEPKLQDGSYDGRDEDRVCVPATVHERLFNERFVAAFIYRARSPESHKRATDRIYEALSRACRFDPHDRSALAVWDTTEAEQVRFYAFLGFDLMLGGSAILTLLVGAVGVANLMFIRVRRRRREIGIQMALGAKPTEILVSTLLETLFLVAVGGVLGLGLAALAVGIVRLTPATAQIGTPCISVPIAGLAITLLGGVGLLAGWFPARRAARMDPVRALAG